jgi:LEA14-like dessication related protein
VVVYVKIVKKIILYSLVVIVFAGCAGIGRISEKPYITLSSINLLNMGVFEQRYSISLRIQNPNDVAIHIKGMSYQIVINEEDFARGVSNKTFIVPAFGEEVVEINATSDFTSFLRQFQHLVAGGMKKVSYSLTGKAKVENRIRRLSFEYIGELDLHPNNKDGNGFFLNDAHPPGELIPTTTK